jgi:D-alanine--poly(phosphoribitol) ligase subunit 2
MENEILEILNENAGSDIDWASKEAIMDDGLIDSLDLVAIVSDLDEKYDIEITVDDMTPENFNSVAAIEKMVARLMEQ